MYCINRFFLKNILVGIPVVTYIVNCHLNDFLAGIAIICYVNIVISLSKLSIQRIKHLYSSLLVSFSCGILWEYVFPHFIKKGVSDVLDVVSYMLGGVVYIIVVHLFDEYT